MAGRLTEASELRNRLQPRAADASIAPLAHIAWQNSRAACYWMAGETSCAWRRPGTGWPWARRAACNVWDPMLLAQTIWAGLTRGRVAPGDAAGAVPVVRDRFEPDP